MNKDWIFDLKYHLHRLSPKRLFRKAKEFVRNYRLFHRHLWKFRDWDYGYDLSLYKDILDRKTRYYEQTTLIDATDILRYMRIARDCIVIWMDENTLDIKDNGEQPLLKIEEHTYKSNPAYDWWYDGLPYVNTRNARRFMNDYDRKTLSRMGKGKKNNSYQHELRIVKARYLFSKILAEKSVEWWE